MTLSTAVSTIVRLRWPLAVAMAIILALSLIIGALYWPDSFFRAYWFGLMIWVQLSIGCLIVLLIQYLTGGEWGRRAAPVLRAGASGFFAMVPLFVPILIVLPHVFPWTSIAPGVSEDALVNKSAWLNTTGFIIRTVIYLLAFGTLISWWAKREIRVVDWSGPSLVVTILTLSFCSVDWIMSLQPLFYSSLFPFIYFAGALVSTFAFTVAVLSWLQLRGVLKAAPDLFVDYGKLLFASIFFWGYITFSQFIIVWSGNLPHEAEWYVVRGQHLWLAFTLLLIFGHFIVPFLLLLSHDLKKNCARMVPICCGIFAVHFLEIFWLMRPSPVVPFHLSISPFDVFMPLVIGGLWIAAVLIFACQSNPRYVHV